MHPDGCLGMASDQRRTPSHAWALLQSMLAGSGQNSAVMCADAQTAWRITDCNQAFFKPVVVYWLRTSPVRLS